MPDLVLEGGHVIDPAAGVNGVFDVEISGGRITQVAPAISQNGAPRIDLSGCYVVPGLIDIHSHVYTFPPTPTSCVGGLNAEAHMFRSGVTTTVDAGTSGWKNFSDFKSSCIDRSRVRILAFLNIAGAGMVNGESEQNPRELDPVRATETAMVHADVIVGIKSAHYWPRRPWDTDHLPWTSVERALEAGGLCEKPVMVDFWPRPPERSYQELLERLRPGDIHTHVFAQQFPVLNVQGKLNSIYGRARENGILFDLGHGAASFWFRNAVPAFRDGFCPDSFSTDLHMANVNGPVINLLHTMSKFLSMGMPIEDVIERGTATPARMIGHRELGTLCAGSEADVTVLKVLDGEFGYTDCGAARMNGTSKLDCALTLRAGHIVYDPSGLSMPDWEI